MTSLTNNWFIESFYFEHCSNIEYIESIWLKLCLSVQFGCSVMSDFLLPHGLQHSRLHCPSPTPRVYSKSSQWCHPIISAFVIPFSSDPIIQLIGNHQKKTQILYQKDTCTLMYNAALFIISKIQKQPKFSLIDECIKNIW